MLQKPDTRSIRVLARQYALTDEEWIELIKERAELLKPHLHEMTLREIGKLPLVISNSCEYAIELSKPEVKGEFPLETRCVFHSASFDKVGRDIETSHQTIPDPLKPTEEVRIIQRFWGLTRSSKWISVELITRSYPGLDYKNRRTQMGEAISVETKEWSNPSLLFRFTERPPRSVWEALGRVIKRWYEHRLHLLEPSKQLADLVEFEEQMVEVIPSR